MYVAAVPLPVNCIPLFAAEVKPAIAAKSPSAATVIVVPLLVTPIPVPPCIINSALPLLSVAGELEPVSVCIVTPDIPPPVKSASVDTSFDNQYSLPFFLNF